MAQCTAKSKRSGKRCKRWASPGRTKCRMHGGRTPRGKDSPHFKHGARVISETISRNIERHHKVTEGSSVSITWQDVFTDSYNHHQAELAKREESKN